MHAAYVETLDGICLRPPLPPRCALEREEVQLSKKKPKTFLEPGFHVYTGF